MNELRDKTAIVGIGQTELSRDSGRSELVLALEAIKAALDDAGLEARDIDGIVRYSMDTTSEADIVNHLGIPEITYHGVTTFGGFGTCALLSHAASAIVAGLANTVLCYRAMNERSGNRFGRADGYLKATRRYLGGENVTYAVGDGIPGGAFAGPYGLLAPTQAFALLAQRYMYEYGIDSKEMTEILGTICVTQRTYANQNPNAMMYDKRLTMEEYRRGRLISTPLRLYDLCLESDGSCAFIITSVERAKYLKQPVVYILTAAQTLRPWEGDKFNIYRDDIFQG